MFNKKSQLTLTNLRDAKACWKLLQFDVKTSCRQVADLFEVMQQLSALEGNPLECGDGIWHQKTRVLGLPDGEEIMTLAFFV